MLERVGAGCLAGCGDTEGGHALGGCQHFEVVERIVRIGAGNEFQNVGLTVTIRVLVVIVPVSLDNAAGVAGIRVQVNYDPQVLTLTDVLTAPLGSQFSLSNEIADGAVTIDLVRATPLATGSGRLALLRFVTNAGATTDLYSDLALAKFEISDESGVRDFAATHTLATLSNRPCGHYEVEHCILSAIPALT